MAGARTRLLLPRWAPPLLYTSFLTLLMFRDGVSVWSGISVGILALMLLGLHLVTRLQKPLGTYLLLGIASAMAGLLLIVTPVMAGSSPLFGAITWAVVTLLGVIWVVYYERTEPR